MLCGIDEAGRGCLAGHLVVAGCVLDEKIEGLTDSKKLTAKKREQLYGILIKKSKYKIVKFSSARVDEKGLSWCLKIAIDQIKNHFKNCEILMDGNTNFGINGVKTLIKADAKVPEVSGASILAKVTRDRLIVEADKLYPQYGFKNHKGYGTKLHVEKIKEFGYCPIHRKSFKIKNLHQPTLIK
ncbi:MAG: ribonuclease HII [Proteobacteria bacterium]|nr:MAG: ribonuclease HII [Pseudomonadota bacterium]